VQCIVDIFAFLKMTTSLTGAPAVARPTGGSINVFPILIAARAIDAFAILLLQTVTR
jgi:hypothetical protein